MNLKLCSLNIQGLRKHTDDLIVKQYCEEFDIICMCETWQQKHDDFSTFLTEYVIFDSPRTRTRGNRGAGGVSVFIKPWLINKGIVKRIYKEFEETVVLFVDKKFVKLNRDLVIFFAYIAPEQSPIYDPENNNGIEL